MADEFQGWRDMLAGKQVDIDVNTPLPGFYKLRDMRDGPWLPVAIWKVNGAFVCRVGAEKRDPFKTWSYAAKNPVSKADAQHAFSNNNIWPGDIGHNSGDLSLAEQIDDVAAGALEFMQQGAIDDQRRSDMAANYRQKLLDLKSTADEMRKAEVEPHIKAQREINAKWKPAIERADTVSAQLRAAVGRYLAKVEAEAKAKADAAAKAENERLMREHQAQQKLAERLDEPAPPPPEFVAPAPVKVRAGGQTGRKTGLKNTTVYEIEDYAAALAHAKDHADVVAAVQKVCFAQARAGATVPGVKATVVREAI